VDAAADRALRETVFRYELVLRITEVTHELLEREALIEAALRPSLGLLALEDAEERAIDPTYVEYFTRLRDLALERRLELQANGTARTTVEARYLAGHPVLFPARPAPGPARSPGPNAWPTSPSGWPRMPVSRIPGPPIPMPWPRARRSSWPTSSSRPGRPRLRSSTSTGAR
jgi:hypothetical protein